MESEKMRTIEFTEGHVRIDGYDTQIISGAMHYFRIHPGYWRDRLLKLKQCGMNTVETYIPWNFHEEKEGEFIEEDSRDFISFIRIAEELGLFVIVRPGPYICSELDLGGLPGWLLGKAGMRLRCSHPEYLKYVDRYMKWVLARLKPLQYTESGPIIAVQIENEYGYFGDDRLYMEHLLKLNLDCGMTVPLFTSDGPGESHLEAGTLPGITATGNSKTCSDYEIAMLRKYNRHGGPEMFMEVHNGNIQCWGLPQGYNDTEDVRKVIRRLIAKGISFNPYPFHGGTSFGFMSGGCSREQLRYRPFCTSYDLDSPLDETGMATPKYFMYQEEIGRSKAIPAKPRRKEYGWVELTRRIALFSAIPVIAERHQELYPRTMEEYGQCFGFIMYRFRVQRAGAHLLKIDGLQDRALIMVNGIGAAVIFCLDPKQETVLFSNEDDFQVDILVENMGRRCGTSLIDSEKKGLRAIHLNGKQVFNVEEFTIPLADGDIDKLEFDQAPVPPGQSGFYQGDIVIESEPADTFVRIPGVRGVCWVNGFNLGRYWEIGPQKTLYLPAHVLIPGKNTITLFEMHGLNREVVYLDGQHDLGVKSVRTSY